MKLFRLIIPFISFVIHSCSDVNNSISNFSGEVEQIYELNLLFEENLDDSDTVTLLWNENPDIDIFSIEIDGSTIELASNSSTYTFSMSPGGYKDIIIRADEIISDTLKIFTSPMSPSSWEADFLGDIRVLDNCTLSDGCYNEFTWIQSPEGDISTYELSKCGYINLPTECSQLSNFTLIDNFNPDNLDYIESKNFGEKACYIMKTIDTSSNSRYSQIICNDLTANTMTNFTISSVSTNLDNKIIIEWDEYSNSDFYEYLIYRNELQDFENGSATIIAEITNPNQTIYEDRDNIGSGKTWYYLIEVKNIFGRTSSSNIESGKSKP